MCQPPRGSPLHSSPAECFFLPRAWVGISPFALFFSIFLLQGCVLNLSYLTLLWHFWKDFYSSSFVHLLQNYRETQFRWQSRILLSPLRCNYPLHHKALGNIHIVGDSINVCFEFKTKTPKKKAYQLYYLEHKLITNCNAQGMIKNK